MRLPLSLLTLFCATAFPAKAQDIPLERPAACESVLTVQLHECIVVNFARCAGAEDFLRQEASSIEGLRFASHWTLEGITLGYSWADGTYSVLVPNGSQTTTIADMLTTGTGRARELYARRGGTVPGSIGLDLTQSKETDIEVEGGVLTPFLTQGTVQVDFSKGAYEARLYYDPKSTALFEGEYRITWEDGTVDEVRSRPARMIYPGEAGFGTTTPEFDCNNLSLLSPHSARRRS